MRHQLALSQLTSRYQITLPELLKARSRELSVTRWPRAGSLTMRDSALAAQTRRWAGQVRRTVQPSTK